MSYLERVAECHRWVPDDYRPFAIDDLEVGRVHHRFARRLEAFPKAFDVSERAVSLVPELGSVEARSAAVGEALLRLKDEGAIPRWRDEIYPVVRRWDETPLMTMERAAVPLFGVRAYGVHMNGLVPGPDGLKLWVARRAKDKATAPGKLDHIVAGGQPHGIGIKDNLIKEAAEEASLPPALAARALPVGFVSYRCEREEGLRDDVLFCYDLELPADFVPVNTDREIESFWIWPIERVLETVRETDEFKFNVSLVLLDLAVRRGLLQPDEPDYEAIVDGLRLPAER